MGDQAVADLAARQASVAGAGQDAEDVVLGAGQVLGLEQRGHGAFQFIGGPREVEEHLQRYRMERLGLLDVTSEAASHGRD